MDKRQKRQYEMLVRVRDFGKAHQAAFPDGGEGARAFAGVSDALREVDAFSGGKQTGQRAGRQTKQVVRQALLAQLRAIAGAAQVLAKTTPDADAKFPLPKGRSDVAVLQAALLFRTEAEAVQADFARCGLPPTFIDDLQQAITGFEQAIAERHAGKTDSKVSQAAIRAALRRGVDAVNSLDVLVPIAFGGAPTTLAVWKSERRIEAVASTASAASGAHPPTTPASQVAAVTAPSSGADDAVLKTAA